VPIFLRQKIRKPNCKWRKALENTFQEKGAHKMLIKLIPLSEVDVSLQLFSMKKSLKKKKFD